MNDDHRTRPRRHRGEGTYWQRPNGGAWVYTMKLDGGGSRSVSARTKKELEPKVNKLKADISRGVGAGGAAPFRIWARYWLDNVCPERVKPTTLISHRSKMEQYAIPILGRYKIRDIKPEHVRALYREMVEAGLSTATIRQTHAVLSRCLKVAVMDGKIDRNPCENVEPPQPTAAPELKALTVAECARVLIWLRQNRDAKEVARWSLALLGGLRQGESLGLDWSAVDLKNGVVHVSRAQAFIQGEYILQAPKTSRSIRTVPLMSALSNDLMSYWVAAGKPSGGLLFGPANVSAESRKWKNHQKLAGIVAPVNVHACRKTTASILAAAGVPTRIIADILGQENTEVTDAHYIKTEIDIRRAGIDKGNKLITKSAKKLSRKSS